MAHNRCRIKTVALWRRLAVRKGLLRFGHISALIAALFLSGGEIVDAASPRLILEVINRHFTVGKKIPSVYLRVYENGTAECHTEKYSKEPDVVKTKAIPAHEIEKLKRVLEDRALSNARRRYERMYPVVDSWMEWTIKVRHSRNNQTIQIAGFAPWAANKENQPYPDVVLKLGCSIEKLRREVYGETRPESGECKVALAE